METQPNLLMLNRASRACNRDPVCLGLQSEVCPAVPYASLSGTVLITGGLGYIGSNTVVRFYDNSPNLKIVVLDTKTDTSVLPLT